MATSRIITNSKQGDDVPLAQALPSYGATAPVAVVTMDGREDAPLIAAEDDASAPVLLLDTAAADGPVYRDVWFAVLFWIHFAVMLYLGIAVAPAGYQRIPNFNLTSIEEEIRKSDDTNDVSEEDFQKMEEAFDQFAAYIKVYPYRIFMYLVLPCLLVSFGVAFATTVTVIKPCPKPIVYSTLVGSLVAVALVMLSSAIASHALPMWIVTIASLAAVGYYVKLAWRIVPFAAINLKVALEAMGRNWGVYLLAFVFAELGFAWNMYWLYVTVGMSMPTDPKCMEDETAWENSDDCSSSPWIFLALLLSLMWTSTILMNTVQTTVAGIVATWCFVADEADHCCSPAVVGSLVRSLTYSFGSICFGSLLQAIMSVLRYVVENARNRRDEGGDQDLCGSLFFCILDCIFRYLEDILDYFNQWAYW